MANGDFSDNTRGEVDLGDLDALLFDLGGVVIDIDFQRVFAKWGELAGVDPATLSERWSMDTPYKQHEVGAIDGAEYFRSLRSTLGLDLSDDKMITGWNSVHIGLIEGIEDILTAAATRWRLFGFTNSNPTHRAAATVRFGQVFDRFEHIFDSSTIGLRKPNREAFEHCAEHMGIPLGRIGFFDDSPENVEGARAIGLPAVLVTSANDIRTALRL